jgi:hypothetical protein
MTEQSFEVFYNSLSVGWHLRRVAEADPQPMTAEQWDRFVGWMERHNLKLKPNEIKSNSQRRPTAPKSSKASK